MSRSHNPCLRYGCYINQSLDNLTKYEGGQASRVVNVLFGQVQPALVAVPEESGKINGAASAQAFVALTPGLNDSQKAAVAFALSTPDIALIHGPPGTGTQSCCSSVACAVLRNLAV